MTINTLPGLRKALDLLDAFSAEREPSEVLVEFRKQLTGEIDDNLPAVSDVQAWAERMLYQTEGQLDMKVFTESAAALLNMQIIEWAKGPMARNGFSESELPQNTIEFIVACSRRRIRLTFNDKWDRGGKRPTRRAVYRLTKINVEE